MSAAALSPSARRDLLAAARWIAKRNPAAAPALSDAVRSTAALMGEHRHIGHLRPDLAEQRYRFVPLAGFPYILNYNAGVSPPLIVRIVHGARSLPDLLRDL